MKTRTIIVAAAALLAGIALLNAQDTPVMPETPPPQKEHQWLERFAGQWESEVEVKMHPDQPPVKVTGTETVRMIGGFWLVAEGNSEMMGRPFTYLLTLGYDPEKQKFVGTWMDSASSHLGIYEGSVDSSGAILTLESEGPCPMFPGQRARFRDVVQFVGPDQRVLTSSMKVDDGDWTTTVTGTFRRK